MTGPSPGDCPAAVTLPANVVHCEGNCDRCTHAGWLGPRHDPLELKPAQSSRDDSFASWVRQHARIRGSNQTLCSTLCKPKD